VASVCLGTSRTPSGNLRSKRGEVFLCGHGRRHKRARCDFNGTSDGHSFPAWSLSKQLLCLLSESSRCYVWDICSAPWWYAAFPSREVAQIWQTAIRPHLCPLVKLDQEVLWSASCASSCVGDATLLSSLPSKTWSRLRQRKDRRSLVLPSRSFKESPPSFRLDQEERCLPASLTSRLARPPSIQGNFRPPRSRPSSKSKYLF
jgi:hypothetical protein